MRNLLLLLSILLTVGGCGVQAASKAAQESNAEFYSGAEDTSDRYSPRTHQPRSRKYSQRDSLSMGGGGDGAVETESWSSGEVVLEGENVGQQNQEEDASDSNQRRIIYTANIELVVNEFDGLEKKIQQTIKDCKGYLAKVDLGRMQGERRTGTWTARIPVEQYEKFLAAVGELGVPVSQRQNSQDVTEEFVDLTARIANQKKLEARILELLERPDDKIQHVIEVEKELARVREAIERMEGRIRYLTDQSDLTTVTISAREERDYQPPQAPTLNNRVGVAWSTSISNTKTALSNLLVNFVGSLIPIAFTIAGFIAFWFIIGRRLWKWLLQEYKNRMANRDAPTTQEVANE